MPPPHWDPLYLVGSIVQISTYSYSYIGGTKRRLYDRGTGHFVMHTAASVIADHVTWTSDNLKWSGNTKLYIVLVHAFKNSSHMVLLSFVYAVPDSFTC